MYIATMNYLSKDGMVLKDSEVKEPSKGHIAKGLVKEVKIQRQEVTKNADKSNKSGSSKPRK